MRKGALAGLRKMRRWLVQAVALALLLPALIGLVPQPALSAAAALDRDLMLSVCGQAMPGQGDGGQQHRDHDHCVLCSSHGASWNPSLDTAEPAFAARPRLPGIPQAATAQAIAPPLLALLDASPPRGPPAGA